MVIATTIVELSGWGPRVAEVVDRIEQGFALLLVALLFLIFSVAWAATSVAFRR